jgi:hypothetical protein
MFATKSLFTILVVVTARRAAGICPVRSRDVLKV